MMFIGLINILYLIEIKTLICDLESYPYVGTRSCRFLFSFVKFITTVNIDAFRALIKEHASILYAFKKLYNIDVFI